jgi:serine/threonine protein phosphatase 1
MTSRQIVVGDVHGHYDTLIRLLENISLEEDDQVYFLGDLIDRGPKSAQVVEFVIRSGYECLLGNHEQMLLEVLGAENPSPKAFRAWASRIGRETIASYGEGIPKHHLNWMKSLPLYKDLGKFWLVHAGVHPYLPLEQQTAEQFCWIREEFLAQRKPFFKDKLIVTGHTITFTLTGVLPGQIARGEGWINIDTGAYHNWSGWLTAVDLTHGQVYQANVQKKEVRQLSLEAASKKVNPAQMMHRQTFPQSS